MHRPAHARIHQRRAGVLGLDRHVLLRMQGGNRPEQNRGNQLANVGPFSELVGFLPIDCGAADWRVGCPVFLGV